MLTCIVMLIWIVVCFIGCRYVIELKSGPYWHSWIDCRRVDFKFATFVFGTGSVMGIILILISFLPFEQSLDADQMKQTIIYIVSNAVLAVMCFCIQRGLMRKYWKKYGITTHKRDKQR